MLENKETKVGRTLFDLIAEYPKATFYIVLSILLIAAILIIFGIPFRVGNLEVGINNTVAKDTVSNVRTDTLLNGNVLDNAKSTFQVQKIKSKDKGIAVKSGDTIIKVLNQPANINTGTNTGIIGNNNEVNVNVNEFQRILDLNSKKELLNLINQGIESNKLTDTCIRVGSFSGNNEAFAYATQILQFLKQKYPKAEGIAQFQGFPVIKGVEVGLGPGKCIEVNVGYK